MQRPPEIAIVKVDHGVFPEASSLNRRIAPDSPLLVATLDIRWDEPDPASVVGGLEEMLRLISSSFSFHQCRGPHVYHVFTGGSRGSSAAAPSRLGRRPLQWVPARFDGCLALAHLIEHAIIDFQCGIAEVTRCSGLTGAHRSPTGRFDLMIECRDFSVGRCCLALAVVWLTAGAAGTPIGAEERRTLSVARLAYRQGARLLTPIGAAAELGISEAQAGRALEALRQVGFLSEPGCTMNFSGLPSYRVAGTRPTPSVPAFPVLPRL
jgi:hypothetical protein